MWRMMTRLATATLTATLALALNSAPKADAAALSSSYSYTTTGSISGMTGVQPISFYGLFGSGTLTTPSSFTLGEFVTNPLPATATLTYNETPFTIDMVVRDLNSSATAVQSGSGPYFDTDYRISGVLNGSITGSGSSKMSATVTSVSAITGGTSNTPPFPASDLQVNVPLTIAAPNGSTDGFSTLTAQVTAIGLPAPAPEPAPVAVFGVALTAWALRRRSRSARRPGLDQERGAPMGA